VLTSRRVGLAQAALAELEREKEHASEERAAQSKRRQAQRRASIQQEGELQLLMRSKREREQVSPICS
jgi:hypothetical protein